MTIPTHDQREILYRHRNCPEWGLAILSWERVDKRGYQFEDGKLRVFKSGYYAMLEDVDPPADQTRCVLDHLNRALGRTQAVQRSTSKQALISFIDQVGYFKTKYPEGFMGAAWLEKYRGNVEKRLVKSHRDPAVKFAQDQLAVGELDRLIANQQYEEVINTLVAVLEQNNLVTATKIKPLRSAPYHNKRTIALTLRELLYGEGAFKPRFGSYVTSLGAASWELATAPLALVYPKEYICVKPSVFEQQALWLTPRLVHVRSPGADTYQHYLKMAGAVLEQLKSADLHPQDLLDVHDFIEMTLCPAARKLMVKTSYEGNAQAATPRKLASDQPELDPDNDELELDQDNDEPELDEDNDEPELDEEFV